MGSLPFTGQYPFEHAGPIKPYGGYMDPPPVAPPSRGGHTGDPFQQLVNSGQGAGGTYGGQFGGGGSPGGGGYSGGSSGGGFSLGPSYSGPGGTFNSGINVGGYNLGGNLGVATSHGDLSDSITNGLGPYAGGFVSAIAPSVISSITGLPGLALSILSGAYNSITGQMNNNTTANNMAQAPNFGLSLSAENSYAGPEASTFSGDPEAGLAGASTGNAAEAGVGNNDSPDMAQGQVSPGVASGNNGPGVAGVGPDGTGTGTSGGATGGGVGSGPGGSSSGASSGGNSTGDGGGGGGGGAGCFLATHAMNHLGIQPHHPARKFFAGAADQFIKAYPETGRRQILAYQGQAKQIIAAIQRLPPDQQKQIAQWVHSKIVQPTGAKQDMPQFRDRMARTTLALSHRLNVPVKPRHLALLQSDR